MPTTLTKSGRRRRQDLRLGKVYQMPGGRPPVRLMPGRHASLYHHGEDQKRRNHSPLGQMLPLSSVGAREPRMSKSTFSETKEAKTCIPVLDMPRRRPPPRPLPHEAYDQNPTVTIRIYLSVDGNVYLQFGRSTNVYLQSGRSTSTTNRKDYWSRGCLTSEPMRRRNTHRPRRRSYFGSCR